VVRESDQSALAALGGELDATVGNARASCRLKSALKDPNGPASAGLARGKKVAAF
jgi:hypothetical protein